jgi:hypothetical protein
VGVVAYEEKGVEAVSTPVRFQLSRRRGYRKPEGCVVCTRASRWGNPYKLTDFHPLMSEPARRAMAIDCFQRLLAGQIENGIHRLKFTVEDVRRELAGKDLGCFCALSAECHVDTLLRVAAGGEVFAP